ncbi:MAG: dipeptide epimerase [Myxococcales bacterium]|nr:dipeptide epimerase [Myxococcales bacterium]
MKLFAAPLNLPLSEPFVTARGPRTEAHNVAVRVEHEGVVGVGEAAPIARFSQTQQGALEALHGVVLEAPADLAALERQLDALAPRFVGQEAALCALDIALHDWLGRARAAPLWRLFGLQPTRVRTSMTVSLQSPSSAAARAAQLGERFALLKVKLGGSQDEALIEAVRARCPEAGLRADANEGWTNPNHALAMMAALAAARFELVEQPLPAGQWHFARRLEHRAPLPMFADEDLAGALDAEKLSCLAGCYHGVNVKLDKVGGLLPARRWIAAARAQQLSVMVGCMASSSLAIAAAAQIAPLCDVVDLDGSLLLARDPFEGLEIEGDEIVLADRPGHGVTAVLADAVEIR